MMDGKGTLYLLDLAGSALMSANAEIARLTAENEQLRQQLAPQPQEPDPTR